MGKLSGNEKKTAHNKIKRNLPAARQVKEERLSLTCGRCFHRPQSPEGEARPTRSVIAGWRNFQLMPLLI